MINFFRKKRKSLADENKALKYTRYAIGEIVLVVIGILIALQINTWNVNRINSVKEIEYLTGLKNDLLNQITGLKNSKQFSDYIINEAETLLGQYNSKSSFQEIDSLNATLSHLMYTNQFLDIRTTFNELNSTGQLNLIQNKKLRSQIIEFYQNSSKHKISINGNIVNVFYEHIFPVLKSSIIIQLKDFGHQVTKFNEAEFELKMRDQLNQGNYQPPSSFEIINAVSARIITEAANRNYIEKSLEEALTLLLDLEDELKLEND